MPPDAVPPPPRLDATPSSRNAVRAGVLAALSSPPAAAPEAPPAPAAAVPVQAPPAPPARGFGAMLRAAGRRGMFAARPLAMPFLHRLQMRMRTAVNESDLAARTADIERALAALHERLDAVGGDLAERTAAARREVVASTSRRLDALDAALAARTDAARREVAEAAAANARRLDALDAALAERTDAARGELAGVGEIAAANARRLDALGAAAADGALRQEAALRRLDAVDRAVAEATGVLQVHLTRRPPVPVGGDFLVYTPDGVLLVPAEDLRFLAVIADGGVLETGTRRVLAALLRPGGVFLDVGANVGTMTLLGARAVGPAGRVFAVEPTPRIAALLRRSMAVNDVADRVSVSECAAGEGEGEALLHLEEIMSHNTLFPAGGQEGRGTARVRVSPADALVPAGTAVDVAKIDAEGAELQVWRGMGRILAESPDLCTVLEFGRPHLERVGVSPDEWLREVQAPGFAPYTIDDMTGVCRPADAASLAGVFSANVLLLRPGAAERHPGLAFAP